MIDAKRLEGFRVRIDEELKQIAATLEPGSGDSVELDQTRVGRLSRMDAMQQQAMASGMKERTLLRARRLEAALLRIQSGEFGSCCRCAEEIAEQRLEADLGTPFCTGCQAELDASRA